jgi:hypothetical protein
MAKRSVGELNDPQRKVLNMWAQHMGVSERHMVNWLNNMDNRKDDSPWDNLDTVAGLIHDCPDC